MAEKPIITDRIAVPQHVFRWVDSEGQPGAFLAADCEKGAPPALPSSSFDEAHAQLRLQIAGFPDQAYQEKRTFSLSKEAHAAIRQKISQTLNAPPEFIQVDLPPIRLRPTGNKELPQRLELQVHIHPLGREYRRTATSITHSVACRELAKYVADPVLTKSITDIALSDIGKQMELPCPPEEAARRERYARPAQVKPHPRVGRKKTSPPVCEQRLHVQYEGGSEQHFFASDESREADISTAPTLAAEPHISTASIDVFTKLIGLPPIAHTMMKWFVLQDNTLARIKNEVVKATGVDPACVLVTAEPLKTLFSKRDYDSRGVHTFEESGTRHKLIIDCRKSDGMKADEACRRFSTFLTDNDALERVRTLLENDIAQQAQEFCQQHGSNTGHVRRAVPGVDIRHTLVQSTSL